MRYSTVRAACVIGLLMPAAAAAQDEWARADSAVRRLDPAAIPGLPDEVVRTLKTRGCTIPQAFGTVEPHNVVAGDFRGDGRVAWAALCSRARISTILVIGGGDRGWIDSLGTAPDRDYLQGMGYDRIAFSRQLSVVDSAFIWRQAHEFGGPPPAGPTHVGLQDSFLEKASIIWYWHQGRWRKLQGVD